MPKEFWGFSVTSRDRYRVYSQKLWFFEMEPILTFIFEIEKHNRGSCSEKHDEVDIVINHLKLNKVVSQLEVDSKM